MVIASARLWTLEYLALYDSFGSFWVNFIHSISEVYATLFGFLIDPTGHVDLEEAAV